MGKNIELEQLVINKLTQAQYDALAVKNPGELYFITDANPTKEVETQLAELSEKVPEPISTYESFPEATAENVGMRVVYTGDTIEAPYIENEDGSVSTVFLDPYLTRGHTFMLVPVQVLISDTESITIYMWQDVIGAIPPFDYDMAGQVLSTNGMGYEWTELPEAGLTKEEADQTYLPLSGGTLTGALQVEGISPSTFDSASILTLVSKSDDGEIYGSYTLGATAEGFSFFGNNLLKCGTILPALRGQTLLGNPGYKWKSVYTTSLNNGEDITIPTGGGTLARLEDIPESTQVETIPEASVDNMGKVLQYIGETNETYTNGYFYKSQGDTTTTEESVVMSETSGAPITMSDPNNLLLSAWETNTGNKESFAAYYMPSGEINLGPYPCNGEMLYTVSAEEVAAAGITVNGYDVSTLTSELAFDAVYTPASTTIENLRWEQVSVQPASETLPDQTNNAGKFLMTDGATASWSDKPLVNKATAGGAYQIGDGFAASGTFGLTFGRAARADGFSSIAFGDTAIVSADYAIQFGSVGSPTTNNDPNTFKVANRNGNFEIMDAQGNIPLDRLTYVTDQIGDISAVLDSINGETLEG